MTKIADDLYLNAIDLRAVDESRFESKAIPVAEIPRVKIRVKDCADEAAIASVPFDLRKKRNPGSPPTPMASRSALTSRLRPDLREYPLQRT